MANFDRCHLHIPHKDWANDPRESENYRAIERWVKNFIENCMGGGACGCGDTLHVNAIGKVGYTGPSGNAFDAGGTVDAYGYGYTGGTSISWDNTNHLFTINENGIYSVSFTLNIQNWVPNANEAFLGCINRNDRVDNVVSGVIIDTENKLNPNGVSPTDLISLCGSGTYPMPAGAQYYVQYADDDPLFQAFDVQNGFLAVTKVNCCTLPTGPP